MASEDSSRAVATPLAFPAEFAALRGEARLAVYIDLKSPYAYLAVEPTRAMARSAGVEIDWRPFTLDIPSYLGSATLDKGAKKVAKANRTPEQWSGVKYAYRDARRYATPTGRTVRGTVKIWDSSLAGIAMLWAKRHGCLDPFLDIAYPPFWKRDLDIDDLGVLEDTLASAGAPRDGFRDWVEGEGRALHDQTNEAAFDAGVYGVPTYLVEDEMWFGREHLPRVAWILGGRKGNAPPVANRSFDSTGSSGAIPASEDIELSAALDLRHPFSALALRPTLEFEEDTGHRFDWLPHAGRPLNPPSEEAAGDDRGIRHRRHRARMIGREIAIYADAQGMALREPYRAGSPDEAHAAWLWVRKEHPESLRPFLLELFRRYWSLELEPDSRDSVASLLGDCGLDSAACARWIDTSGRAALERCAETVETAGLGAVPAFRVRRRTPDGEEEEDEVFQGRQHLAMIRWILGGRTGSPPI